MSQYIVFNDKEPNNHKIVWGRDDHTGSGWYLLVFDRNHEIVVSMDQLHDGLDRNSLLEYLVFYGIDPLYAERTIQRDL